MTFAYQWARCIQDGSVCANASGQTGATYVLGAADVGAAMRVSVTATNAGGSAGAGSAITSRVAPQPGSSGDPVFPKAKTIPIPRSSRWFVRRLRGARAKSLLELVTILDSVMNNTSVILLFEVGGKKLLFPGDAQIENWSYALSNSLPLLAGVDVYKVGHHGSRNATPKSLYENFKKRGDAKKKGRLIALISTKSGKHGNAKAHTEVPRATLVKALQAETDYRTTQKVKGSELCFVERMVF